MTSLELGAGSRTLCSSLNLDQLLGLNSALLAVHIFPAVVRASEFGFFVLSLAFQVKFRLNLSGDGESMIIDSEFYCHNQRQKFRAFRDGGFLMVLAV